MYRWAEHTGEIELEIRSETEEGVYAVSLEAMAELLGEEPGSEPRVGEDARPARGDEVRDIAVEAPDRSRLLADFLGELAFLAETERFVPIGLERLGGEAGGLRATVRGRTGDPPHLVKAVTYHGLRFEAVDGGWRATVVFDV